jgi:hypothetical protein
MSINIIRSQKENGGREKDIIIVIKYSRVFINENAEKELNFFIYNLCGIIVIFIISLMDCTQSCKCLFNTIITAH